MSDIIDIPDEADLGARMLNLALAEERGVEAPADADNAEPPPAAGGQIPATEAVAPGAPASPEAPPAVDEAGPPVDGGLGDTRNWEQLEDGSVKLANGHVYASPDAALDALFHAQQHIATTRRAPAVPDLTDADFELDDDDEDDAPTPLLRPGMPIGGEPESLEELAAWATENPGAAAQWALRNQDRLEPKDVSDLYAHWSASDPAAAANYSIQIQMQAAQAEIERAKQEVLGQLNPVLEERRAEQISYWTEQIKSLPLFDHYGPRIQAFAEDQGPDYIAYLGSLSPQEEYEELRDVYSRLRVDDSIAASQGNPQAQAVVAATTAAAPANGGRPVPVPPAGVPVTEGRGNRGPDPTPPGDMTDVVRQAIAAYQGANDLFGNHPT